jgi:hypothetical protein
MDNHYHLMNETLDANLSVGMRQLNSLYTQTFNRRHTRAESIRSPTLSRIKGFLVRGAGAIRPGPRTQ